MKRTRLAPRGYCPPDQMRFAIISGDGRYLRTKEVPFQWEVDLDKALLWDHRRDAEDFLMRYRVGLRRCRVVQVREQA